MVAARGHALTRAWRLGGAPHVTRPPRLSRLDTARRITVARSLNEWDVVGYQGKVGRVVSIDEGVATAEVLCPPPAEAEEEEGRGW